MKIVGAGVGVGVGGHAGSGSGHASRTFNEPSGSESDRLMMNAGHGNTVVNVMRTQKNGIPAAVVKRTQNELGKDAINDDGRGRTITTDRDSDLQSLMELFWSQNCYTRAANAESNAWLVTCPRCSL